MGTTEALDTAYIDRSIAEILSTICIGEARELKARMLRLQGQKPMEYSSWSMSMHNLETPLFGGMVLSEETGTVTYGYKASLSGISPEVFFGPSVEEFFSNPAAFADYTDSLLSLECIGIDHDNKEVYRQPVGYFDTYRGLIIDENLNGNGQKSVDQDKAAELRVILEYGLKKLFNQNFRNQMLWFLQQQTLISNLRQEWFY